MSDTKRLSDRAADGNAPQKQPYEAPILSRMGAIADITRAGMTGALTDVNPTNSAE